jgi:glycosyltransferase involved in cell wall biosynthesis
MLAWRNFCDSLTKEESAKCVLFMHTQPVDDAGTDLPACKEAFCPNYDVQFSTDKIMPERMNQYYNIADATIHLSDNEGFGIATAESLAAGTPIIVSVTGGLQDQCGFVGEDGKPVEFTPEWGSNSDGRVRKHGKWVTPVYPGARMVQGSPPTPYILGDYTKYEDAAEAMMYWHAIGHEKRKECGAEGRRWLSNEGGLNSENMCKTMIEGIEGMMTSWKGRERFNVHRHDEFVGHKMPNGNLGLVFPKIDKTAVLNKFDNLK